MQILIVNFKWSAMTHLERLGASEEIAPEFAKIPGLISKVWLADEETSTYGGVYTFEDAASRAAYRQSELFAGVQANPDFSEFAVTEFEVMEAPSLITSRGLPASVS